MSEIEELKGLLEEEREERKWRERRRLDAISDQSDPGDHYTSYRKPSCYMCGRRAYEMVGMSGPTCLWCCDECAKKYRERK